MKLFQNGYDCAREIGIFYNMFFTAQDEPEIFINCKYENNVINAYTALYFNGGEYFDDCCFPFDTSGKSANIIKKVFTATCAKSFVHAAMQTQRINNPWGVMCGIRPAKNARELRDAGMSDDEIREIFKSVYEVSPKKTELALEVSKNEADVISRIGKDTVSLYIGIPFCPTRCLYCSFVSTDIRVSGKYMDNFTDCLSLEIKKTSEILKRHGLNVESIYIGGGTPTALDEKNLKKMLSAVDKYIDMSYIKEYTVEAGRADTITEEKLDLIRAAGADRISINPQTMNDKTLRLVGRRHSVADFINAFGTARKKSFKNINTDLIMGLPGESFEDFRYSLDEIIKLNPEDITIHTMCVKNAARLKHSDIAMTEAAEVNKMADYSYDTIKKTGRIPYYMYRQKNMVGNLENVGYSYPDKMGMYNINIMEEKQTIIALGGGGSTKIVNGDKITRVFNFKDPKEYINSFDKILEKKEETSRILKG